MAMKYQIAKILYMTLLFSQGMIRISIFRTPLNLEVRCSFSSIEAVKSLPNMPQYIIVEACPHYV